MKVTYHQKREEFEKCKYYDNVLAATTMWLAKIPEEDSVVELVKSKAAAQNDSVSIHGADQDEVLPSDSNSHREEEPGEEEVQMKWRRLERLKGSTTMKEMTKTQTSLLGPPKQNMHGREHANTRTTVNTKLPNVLKRRVQWRNLPAKLVS